MDDKYSISYQERATSEEEDALFEGINQISSVPKGINKMQTFAFFVRDSEKKILAGATGMTMYGSLYLELLWVSPELRQHGMGSKLIQECESLAQKRGCTFIFLMTMDWEALPFYQKLGFDIEFTREGFEKNTKMYVLRKNLSKKRNDQS